jgi:Zinc-finger double-stranded RNA-binding
MACAHHCILKGNVARRVALQTEISEVLRPFYCTVCEKQFQNVAQYDEHTNSYAHHHKIRFREMQNTQRVKQNTPEEQDRRKEKERRREEKELRKIAAAAGVAMAKPTTSAQLLAPIPTAGESKPAAFKKGGWANISTGTAGSSPSASEAPPTTTRAGWGVVGPSANTSPSPASDTTSSGRFPTTPETWQPRDQFGQAQDVQQRPLYQPAPAFRAGGWSSIDSTTRIPPPSSSPCDVSTPSSAMAVDVHRPSEEQLPGPVSTPTVSSAHLLPETAPQPLSALPSLPTPSVNTESMTPKPLKSKKAREIEMRENARSGWQSFQRGGRRK